MLSPQSRRAVLHKIAAEQSKAARRGEKRIYSPGVVAHEAGHAWMHNQPKKRGAESTDVMSAVEAAGALLPLGILAGGLLINKKLPSPGTIAGSAAVGYIPRLVDEYASSVKGHGALKGSKAFKTLTDEEIAQERNRLIAAGGTYAAYPVSMLGLGQLAGGGNMGWAAVPAAAAAGQIGGVAYASYAKGPKITAREAKALAQEIAPGVPVYATREAFAGGSMYMPAVRNRLIRVLANEELKPFMEEKTRQKLLDEGGILIAPMRGALKEGLLSSIGLGRSLDDKFKEVK